MRLIARFRQGIASQAAALRVAPAGFLFGSMLKQKRQPRARPGEHQLRAHQHAFTGLHLQPAAAAGGALVPVAD